MQNCYLSIGGQSLFENVQLTIHKGDKIGLLGANGTGKSCKKKISVEMSLKIMPQA